MRQCRSRRRGDRLIEGRGKAGASWQIYCTVEASLHRGCTMSRLDLPINHIRPTIRRFPFVFVLVAACSTAAEHADQKAAPAAPAGQAAGSVPAESRADTSATNIVRALYVNRWASQSRRRMAKLVATADSTEINAFVIDMKDEFGLNYKTANP